nr:hypothetical protein [Thetidibacter halocola]
MQIDETGLFIRRQDAPLRQFQVLGERGSGTNVVRKTIQRHLAIDRVESLGWKHGFPGMIAIPRDLLVICVVRHPWDWARSLYARPWHAHPAMQALGFSDFIRAEWVSIIDRPTDFGLRADSPLQGQPLQPDRDPFSGLPFPNLFALRTAKLRALTGMARRGCSLAFLRFEAFLNDPEAMTDRIARAFNVDRRIEGFSPVTRRMGTRFNPSVDDRPPPPDLPTPEDAAFIRNSLDGALEAALGYRYD